MRIAVWHNTLSGGARRALYYQVRGLVERGHDVESWCPSTADQSYLPLRQLIPEHVTPFNPTIQAGRRAGRYVRALRRMREMDRVCRQAAREIEARGFDLLFASPCFYFYMPFIVGYLSLPKVVYLQEPARRFYEASPTLPWLGRVDRHDGSRLARLRRSLADQLQLQGVRVQARREYRNAHACDLMLVNSYYSRESVLRAYGREARVCYIGIDTALFRHERRPRERLIVGMGSFTPNKGIELAIRSVARLAEPRPPLVWIGNSGNPGYEDEMRRLAASLGVRFEPRKLISDAEVVETLNRAALFIYTSRLEPFGFAPLEANACGTPVIAVAEGGVRETVKDGVNGWLVDSEPEAIAEAMARLLNDAALTARLGERACEYVGKQWGLSRAIDRLEANLSQVVDRTGRQGKKACFAH
jgi:glycosyltransferase involved in cell wall biosynthesis